MLEYVSNLPTLGKVTLGYIVFLGAFAAFLYFEIKRSPIYKDDNMRERCTDE